MIMGVVLITGAHIASRNGIKGHGGAISEFQHDGNALTCTDRAAQPQQHEVLLAWLEDLGTAGRNDERLSHLLHGAVDHFVQFRCGGIGAGAKAHHGDVFVAIVDEGTEDGSHGGVIIGSAHDGILKAQCTVGGSCRSSGARLGSCAGLGGLGGRGIIFIRRGAPGEQHSGSSHSSDTELRHRHKTKSPYRSFRTYPRLAGRNGCEQKTWQRPQPRPSPIPEPSSSASRH